MNVTLRRLRRLHADESGMYTMLHMWVFLFFLVLSALFINCAEAMVEKMTSQNAADSAAYSASVVHARALNAVTAANHLTGELNALVVLHHALGGYQLDGERDPYEAWYDDMRDVVAKVLVFDVYKSWIMAELSPASKRPYKGISLPNKSRDRYDVGATIQDARDTLRKLLASTYKAHAAGGWMEVFPPTAAAGKAMVVAAYFMEMKIYYELVFLEKVEDVARSLRGAKRALERNVIPLIQLYVKILQVKAPLDVEAVAYKMAEANGAEGLLYPSVIKSFTGKLFMLPLQQESNALTTNWTLLRRSQIVRATWPWVREWRKPIVAALWVGAPLSLAGMYYENWSETYTLRKSRQFKERQRKLEMDLYVLKDTDITRQEKGREPWTKASGSRRADELFCVLGFGRREAFRVAGGFYDDPNPDGIVAYAQAIAYNANPQRGPIGGGRQPEVGWDTLNWENRVAEFANNGPAPRIKLNWQAKLVPATRIDEMPLRVAPGRIGNVVRRMIPHNFMGNTH